MLGWNVRTFPWYMSKNEACFCWRSLSRSYCTNRTTRRVWEIMERGGGTNKWRKTWCGLNKYWKEKEVNLTEVCTSWYHIHCSLFQNLNCLKSYPCRLSGGQYLQLHYQAVKEFSRKNFSSQVWSQATLSHSCFRKHLNFCRSSKPYIHEKNIPNKSFDQYISHLGTSPRLA